MEFATRGQATNAEGPVEIGNIFYGTEGYLWIDADGRQWQSFLGRKAEKGPGADAATAGSTGSDPRVLTSIEYPHYQNFVDAIRADDPKLLTCDVLEGHLSSALPHLANISYRVGRALTFDPQERDDRRRQGSERAPDADRTARASSCRPSAAAPARRTTTSRQFLPPLRSRSHDSGVFARLRSRFPQHSGVVWQFLRLPRFAGLTVS